MPLDDIRELHSSSGTTGKPGGGGLHRRRHGHVERVHRPPVQMAGVVPGDIAQMAFGYGMFTGGLACTTGCSAWAAP